MRFFKVLYYHIPFFICYAFNAVSMSADASFALIWLGVNSHFAFIMSMLVITGWFLLFLSSHNDTREEAPKDLQTFARKVIDIDYLKQHQDSINPNDLKRILNLTIFHYFKTTLADRLYAARKQKSQQSAQSIFNEVKAQLEDQKPVELFNKLQLKELGFAYKENLRQPYGYTHDIDTLENNLSLKSANNLFAVIKKLDQYSIRTRNETINNIQSHPNNNTVDKLVLKIEHSYTLAYQRSLLPFINAFSKINAVSNGLILLASGYLKVGINPLYLTAFACSGMACSYILTGPKILNIMQNISGYWETYLRSTSDNTKAQRSSFVFKLSLVTAALTAAASGLFAYYVLSTFLHVFTHPAILITGYCMAGVLTCIAFSGAFCLYFDSIFSILSGNKKDIYSPEDSLSSLLSKNIPSFRTILGLVILACLTGLLYYASLQQNMVWLYSTAALALLVTCLIPDARQQSIAFITLGIGLCIAICNIHQVCAIFALTLNPISIPGLVLFASVQASTMTCTFYKGFRKISQKVGSSESPATAKDLTSKAGLIIVSDETQKKTELPGRRYGQ